MTVGGGIDSDIESSVSSTGSSTGGIISIEAASSSRSRKIACANPRGLFGSSSINSGLSFAGGGGTGFGGRPLLPYLGFGGFRVVPLGLPGFRFFGGVIGVLESSLIVKLLNAAYDVCKLLRPIWGLLMPSTI